MSTTSPPLPSTTLHPGLGEHFLAWEQAIEAANHACGTASTHTAHQLYEQAQTLAHALLAGKPWLHPHCASACQQQMALDASLAAVVVTCHNRAHLYQQENHASQSTACCQQAHACVQRLLADPSLPEHLYPIVSRHLLRTLAQLPALPADTATRIDLH